MYAEETFCQKSPISIYIYICIHIHRCLCIHTRVRTHIHIRIHICRSMRCSLGTHRYTRIDVYMYTCRDILSKEPYIRINMHMQFVCMYMHIHIHWQTCWLERNADWTDVLSQAPYMYIHIPLCIRTHVHKQTHKRPSKRHSIKIALYFAIYSLEYIGPVSRQQSPIFSLKTALHILPNKRYI